MPRTKSTKKDKVETTEVKATKTKKTAAEGTATVEISPSVSGTITDLKEEKISEIDLLKEQIEELKAALTAAKNTPAQIVVAAPDSGERVHLLWQAEVADDNIIEFGDGGMYGRIVGKTGSIYIPKNDLSRILDAANRLYLDRRWLIVVSGLTDDEREALGVAYRDGEILDKKAFQKLLELDKEELLEIYPELCESHKEMIAKRFYEAYASGKPVKRDIVVALNNIAPVEAFKAVIDGMNKADLGE